MSHTHDNANTEADDFTIGSHVDPAETRVEQTLENNSALDTFNTDKTSSKRHYSHINVQSNLPDNFTENFKTGGSRLPQGLRNEMETAFDTNFSEVRVHSDTDSNNAAKSMGANAFAAGSHIGFADNQYQPDSDYGKNLIAHELGHVAEERKGQDSPNIIRRNIFEDIGDFFGGARDTFSLREISDYLDVLQAGSIEDNIDSDNKARYIVNEILYRSNSNEAQETGQSSIDLPLRQPEIRGRLVKEMATGIVADKDESAIMKILDNATSFDREIIFREAGSELLLQKIDDQERRDRLDSYILQRNNAEEDEEFPVAWELDHSISGGQLSGGGEHGLFINSFDIEPENHGNRVLRRNVEVPGQADADFPLKGPEPHPRSTSGEGGIVFKVGQTRGNNVDVNPSTPPYPIRGVPYPSIPLAHNQVVEAILRVRLRDEELGMDTTETGSQTAVETGNTTSVGEEVTSETVNEDSSNVQVSNSSAATTTNSQSNGTTATEGSSTTSGEETNVQVEAGATRGTNQSDSTTDTDTTTTTFGGSINISGQISGTLSHSLRAALEAELSVDDLSNLIPLGDIPLPMLRQILRRAPGPVAALLTVLELANGVGVNLSLSLGTESRFEISGSLSGEAAAHWQRETSNSTSTTNQTGSNSSNNVGVSAGRTNNNETTESDSTQVQTGSESSTSTTNQTGVTTDNGSRNTQRDSTTNSTNSTDSQSTTNTDNSRQTRARRVLRAVVDSATLNFRVIRTTETSSNTREEG